MERIKTRTYNRKKIVVTVLICTTSFFVLSMRLGYLMLFQSEYYIEQADELHERERTIKAERGKILDRHGEILANNKTVCSVSVIHNQLTNPEEVITLLMKELDLSEEYVRKRVEKYSSMERIKSNVPKEIGDRIREANLNGVMVDEDYKRYYPNNELASKILGFTGSDNQGIIGLEVIYEDYLQGEKGIILTVTDAKGVEQREAGEKRIEPSAGKNLRISIDRNIQSYGTQLAKQVMKTKEAEHVSLIVLNPQNGEIFAMVDVPEFDLNSPYDLNDISANNVTSEQEKLNQMWRNGCINDTYEPGSTFKIITAAAGLESGAVKVEDGFHCPGYIIVEDRRIRCHKTIGHGSETFLKATMNSCNPVFVTVGLRMGAEKFYSYFREFGLLGKTGVDLPGEAGTIMHKLKDIGEVELATVSFGQSFQITPIMLIRTAASLVNGGKLITPHLGMEILDQDGNSEEKLEYPVGNQIIREETSETLCMILEQVVQNGTGKNGYVEGFRVGGKTATSQTLPRGTGRYISSYIGFAPADHPQVMALLVVHNPKGIYYGGQVAAPVVRTLFENILPYLETLDYN